MAISSTFDISARIPLFNENNIHSYLDVESKDTGRTSKFSFTSFPFPWFPFLRWVSQLTTIFPGKGWTHRHRPGEGILTNSEYEIHGFRILCYIFRSPSLREGLLAMYIVHNSSIETFGLGGLQTLQGVVSANQIRVPWLANFLSVKMFVGWPR